jgi:hypothetical protein
MQHPDYPDVLAVGCVCAEHMEEDYAGPFGARSTSGAPHVDAKARLESLAKGELLSQCRGLQHHLVFHCEPRHFDHLSRHSLAVLPDPRAMAESQAVDRRGVRTFEIKGVSVRRAGGTRGRL